MPQYLQIHRRTERTRLAADALDFAAQEFRGAGRDGGPAAVVDALRDAVGTGGRLGGARVRLAGSTDRGRSPAHRTLLDGPLRIRLYERRQFARRAVDGRPDLDLLAELLEAEGLDHLLLQSLSPDFTQRLHARRLGGATEVAERIIDGLVAALTRRHEQALRRLGTFGAVLDQTGDPGAVERLRDLYRWAFNYAAPLVQLGDPALVDAPRPQTDGYLEIDDDWSLQAIGGVLDPGITPKVGRVPDLPARLVVLRSTAGITVDLLSNFGPGSPGWQAYADLQSRWRAGESQATPVHTVQPLEALVEAFLGGAGPTAVAPPPAGPARRTGPPRPRWRGPRDADGRPRRARKRRP